MAETAMLVVGACQLAVTVIPQAVAAWPIVWKQVVKICKKLPRTYTDQSVKRNLDIIHEILDTLEHIPDLPWASLSHGQALLSSMKSQAESLEKMLVNDSVFTRHLRKAEIARKADIAREKKEIARKVKEIASTMEIFQYQMRASITRVRQNADCDILGQVQYYQKSQENLRNDLLAKLCEDNLEPMVIETSMEYDNMRRSGTYKKVFYSFQPASGYPRTLTVSRGVRECIEVLLSWLRNLKLMRDTSNVESAVVIGVAFIEVFTEILPEALLHHLCESCSRLEPRAALQFDKNLEFFRSFSGSETFTAIQGKDGLDLEDGIDKVSLILQDSGWTAWNLAQQVSVQLRDRDAANNHRLLVRSSSRDAPLTTSGYADPAVCVLCGIFIDIAGDPVNTEFIRKQHFETCIQKRKRLIAGSSSGDHCPVCGTCWDNMPNDRRQSHANACLDK